MLMIVKKNQFKMDFFVKRKEFLVKICSISFRSIVDNRLKILNLNFFLLLSIEKKLN
jgi:hypothetical protein